MWVLLLVLIPVVLAAGVTLWLRSEHRRGKEVFGIARTEERAGHSEGAVFFYGVAAMAGYQKKACHQRMRSLWSEHGPFDFSAERTRLIRDHCRHNSCGEGFHDITVAEIRRVVETMDRGE